MKTKYISSEGFSEIESLSNAKKQSRKKQSRKKRKLNKLQKTVRFARRASVLIGRSAASKCVKLAGSAKAGASALTKTAGKKFKALRLKRSSAAPKQVLAIDKLYQENREGSSELFSSTVKEAVSGISPRNVPKHAHSEAASDKKTRALLRKKAILAVVACFMAITLSCVTAVGAVSSPQTYVYDNADAVSVQDEVFSKLNGEVTPLPANVSGGENQILNNVGLYIDGELIGVTNDETALCSALNQLLIDYKAGYDEGTTTEYLNDVEVKKDNFADAEIMTADELMAAAEKKLLISLTTDIVYTETISYETITEYDESQPYTYESVETEGVNGEEQITLRTTFVNGEQTDAAEIERKVLKEAVDEVIIKGGSEFSTGSGSFIWPLPYSHAVSSEFGYRWGSLHAGIDIADSGIYGQEIVASDNGTVILAADINDGYGNYVIIDHGNGYKTVYAHCSSLAVYEGQTVVQGETIGYVGSTGNSTGPHLHFEIRENDVQLDPLGFVG